jgi:hypothetical protein
MGKRSSPPYISIFREKLKLNGSTNCEKSRVLGADTSIAVQRKEGPWCVASHRGPKKEVSHEGENLTPCLA